MNFTTKTKKADLVKEVVSRGLFAEVEANKMVKTNLLEAIRNDDSKATENITQADEEQKVSEDKKIESVVANDVDTTKITKEESKKDTSNVSETENKEEPKTSAKKKLPRKNKGGRRQEGLQEQLARISKQLVENSNEESLLADMNKEDKDVVANTDVLVDDKIEDSKQNVDENLSEDEKNELQMQTEILAIVMELKTSNDELTNKIRKLQKYNNKFCDTVTIFCDKMGVYLNKLASSNDENNLPLFNMLYEYWYMFSSFSKSEVKVMNMNESIRIYKAEEKARAEQEAREKAEHEAWLKEERSFVDGECICFENGKPYKAKGITKKKYETYYYSWYEFFNEWLDYYLSEHEKADSIYVITKRKKAINALKQELHDEFTDGFDVDEIEDDVREMIFEALNIFYEDLDKERALAYFLASIDGIF